MTSITLETPASGKYEQPIGLFINNEWVKAIDGKTFETINPTTEKPICSVFEVSDIIRRHQPFFSHSLIAARLPRKTWTLLSPRHGKPSRATGNKLLQVTVAGY